MNDPSDATDPSIPESQPLPESGRIGGVDFGTVRIGIAVSDPSQSFSSPLETYTRRSANLDGAYFQGLVSSEDLVGFVIGLPVHMSGDASAKSKEAVEFGRWLESETGIPIAWVDERYSTAKAREILNQSNLSGKKRKAHLDKIAAQVLLATYLESGSQEIGAIDDY